jgi:hypothetical protein
MTKTYQQVDVENPDLVRFPMFEDAEFVEALIGPGECLYIPVFLASVVADDSVDGGIS